MKNFCLQLKGRRKCCFLIFFFFIYPNFKWLLSKNLTEKPFFFIMDFESSNEILLCHYIFDLQFFDNETTALLKKLEACAGISFVFLILLRGSLHALSHPGVKFAPGWTHFGLLRNLLYCLHVTSGMNFHPGVISPRP